MIARPFLLGTICNIRATFIAARNARRLSAQNILNDGCLRLFGRSDAVHPE
jgi:hypothetical protein